MLNKLLTLWKRNSPFKLAIIVFVLCIIILFSKFSSGPRMVNSPHQNTHTGQVQPNSTGKTPSTAYLSGKGVVQNKIPKIAPSIKGNIRIEN